MTPLDLHGRHGANAPPPSLGWTCPACGQQQVGRLELGCESCGSGKPGSFVGVPPPAQAEAKAVVANRSDSPAPAVALQSSLDDSFIRWVKQTGQGRTDTATYEAFKAGWEMALTSVVHTSETLPGTSESRTIIAALKVFAESVLPDAREEIQSGEFLSIEETRVLIKRWERMV